MMQLFATGHEAFALFAEGSAWLVVGGVVGAFHFLTLRRSAQMLTGEATLPRALVLHLIRLAATAGALTVVARHGAMPLLAATLGIMASRTAVLRCGTLP
jgi:F1F0 ATPase subunit 2